MWSGRANGVLVAELAGASRPRARRRLRRGRGCHLARRAGWQVTGVDVSEVALARAADAAREAGVDVEWVRADIAAVPPVGRL